MAVSAKIVGIELLEEKILKAFQQWAEEDVDDAYMSQKFLDPGEWNYEYPISPGYTERKSGEIVRSPRNIYDLGTLYRSGRENFKLEGAEASWLWDATNGKGIPYAWYVHEGIGTNMTERRWTDDITINFDDSIEKQKLRDRIKKEFEKR
jgi:hypothetical protein